MASRMVRSGLLLALLVARPDAAAALAVGFEAAEFLLIGTGDAGIVGTATAVSNFEIGANSETVPMPGLTLVEPIPSNTLPVATGITGEGDVAITDAGGTFNFSNLELYGDMGVHCAASAASCNAGASNTQFNGLPFPSNGLLGNVDFTALLAELGDAKTQIPALAADITLDFSDDGKWDTNLTITLGAGLTVIDIATGGNDLLLENTNLVIDGPAGAFAIFRVPDDANFNVSQSAILVGDGGIGLSNVLFFSDRADNNQHFNLNNVVVNGIAFWDLGMAGGEVAFNDVQGCTQVIADKINLNDVRLTNCAFVIPEPGPVSLLTLGLAALTAGASAARGRRA